LAKSVDKLPISFRRLTLRRRVDFGLPSPSVFFTFTDKERAAIVDYSASRHLDDITAQ
jgi:hypothetical protein